MTPARVNGVILFLCAMALASPLVAPVPGRSASLFWLLRAVGVAFAVAALVRPKRQEWAVAGVALFLVVAPAVLQMHYRAWSGPHTFCHDSVVQFEEAERMLRSGRNPYAQDFRGTSLERWNGWKDNPAVHHFVYPPFLLLLSTPVEAACRAVLWKSPTKVESLGDRFFDQRIVLLLFFIGLLVLLWKQLRDHPHRAGIAGLVALNPWFGPFIVEGRNDVAMVFWVAAAWMLYEKGRPRMGHLMMGLAIATKTLLLPIVPFLLLAHRRDWLAAGLLLAAPLLLTSAPFLVADAPAFVEDVFGAPAGWGDHPFEIRGWGGLGFANLVLFLGLVSSPAARFPFWIFQGAAYGFCLWQGAKALRREPTTANALLWGTGAVLVVLFFGRFVHDNYFGALLSMAVISQSSRETSPAPHSTSAPA